MKKIVLLGLVIVPALLLAYGWLMLGLSNISHQQSLDTKYVDVILVKSEDNIFLNKQPTNINDLESKLRKPPETTEDTSILISISNPQLPMKYFSNLLTKIVSAHRGSLFLQVGKKNSIVYSLPIPAKVDANDPETEESFYNVLRFVKDIQGNLLKPAALVFYCLTIPVMPLAKSESCLFEGKLVSNYSEFISLLKSNKLFPNKISLIFAWREESTINDFITFLSEMKSNGVRFIQIKAKAESNHFDKYELKIEPAGRKALPDIQDK